MYYFVVEFLFQIFYIEIIQHFLYFQVLDTFKEYGSAIWEISQNLGLFGAPFSFLLLLQPDMWQEQFKAGRVEFTLEFKRTSSIEAVKAWQKNREASRQLLSTAGSREHVEAGLGRLTNFKTRPQWFMSFSKPLSPKVFPTQWH